MHELQPTIRALNEKIRLSASHRIDLYTQSTSLDTELLLLLQQKEALEMDCTAGEEGLMRARNAWDGLRSLFNEARGKSSTAGTVSQPSQLDLSFIPLFPPLPTTPLAITSVAKPQPSSSEVAAFDAEGITPSGDPPLDVDSANPGASARASASESFLPFFISALLNSFFACFLSYL